MELWSVARDDYRGLLAKPVDPAIAHGLVLLWTGSFPRTPATAGAGEFLNGQRDRERHLLCGCKGKNLVAAPRLLCKRVGEDGAAYLSRDSTRPEHDPACPFSGESGTISGEPHLPRSERIPGKYELVDLFFGIGGHAAPRIPLQPLPRRRSDTREDGSSTRPSMATALDLILEEATLNRAHVPYPVGPVGLRIFPEEMMQAALSRVEHPRSAHRPLGRICLIQPTFLEAAVEDLYERAESAWVGSSSPIGYLIFACDDLIHESGHSLVQDARDGGPIEILLDFKIPCARQNVAGPYLVICKVGKPADSSVPIILDAASQAISTRSDWWAVDSKWERESYRNLRHILKAAAEEGLALEAWRPLRWLTGKGGGLFLPDYWLRIRSTLGCWHNFFVEVEGTRDAAGREMKERTIERAKTRGEVWREDRRDGHKERADRLQRATILKWARWASQAPLQANSDLE